MVASIIIDNGSYTCKAGFGGDYEDREELPSVVGRPRYQNRMLVNEPKKFYVGEETEHKTAILNLTNPIECGLITSWDDMEKVWHYIFNKLNVAAQNYAVLLTEPVGNSTKNREKMVKIMFEKFNVRSVMVANQAALSLFDSGRLTGISVNVGHGITQVVPVHEASTITGATSHQNFGGLDLTDYFRKFILFERGNKDIRGHSSTRILNNNKAKHCYVALDFEQEMHTADSSSALEKTFDLPDGQVATIGNERFQVPEAMFQPDFVGKDVGVHQMTYNAIMKCDEKIRKDLFANIVLSGGSTMFPGFVERMQKEITLLAPPDTKVNIVALPERQYSPWIGGSRLASRPPSDDLWITNEEYDESGLSRVCERHIHKMENLCP